MRLSLEITGENEADLTEALERVQRQVDDGYTSGFDSNKTGGYSFTVEGEPAPRPFTSGDHCRFATVGGAPAVQHFDCDERPDGTYTDAKTGRVIFP